jgi:hypothetical protein
MSVVTRFDFHVRSFAIIAKKVQALVQPYKFLSTLPALLGLAGFGLYRVLGAHIAGDAVSRRIIEKLRKGVDDQAPPDPRLTPKQVERLLEQQHRLREFVGDQDFHLLRQALTQQFILTVLVYVLALGLCSLSVYLFVHGVPDCRNIPFWEQTVGCREGNN